MRREEVTKLVGPSRLGSSVSLGLRSVSAPSTERRVYLVHARAGWCHAGGWGTVARGREGVPESVGLLKCSIRHKQLCRLPVGTQ